jgi:hypothetical protein
MTAQSFRPGVPTSSAGSSISARKKVGKMGQDISGMGHDYDIVENLIAGIEKWRIGPARIARGEKTGRADRSGRF